MKTTLRHVSKNFECEKVKEISGPSVGGESDGASRQGDSCKDSCGQATDKRRWGQGGSGSKPHSARRRPRPRSDPAARHRLPRLRTDR